MEEIPSGKAYLQALWSEVLWKAKRDPTPENFDAVDAFIQMHQVFFEANILEPFSYEALFKAHYPRVYKETTLPRMTESDWREEFLRTYNASNIANGPKALWLAIKNNDLAQVDVLIAEEKIQQEDLCFLDEVEGLSVVDFAVCYSQCQEALDKLYSQVLVPRLSVEGELREALKMHQPLAVIQQCCEDFDVEQSGIQLWFERASYAFHHDAARYFAERYKIFVTQQVLCCACMLGDLALFKKLFNPDAPPLNMSLQRLVEVACEHGHLPLIKYLLEDVKIWSVSEKDIQIFIDIAAKRQHRTVVEYLLEMRPSVQLDFNVLIESSFERNDSAMTKYWLEVQEKQKPRDTPERETKWLAWLTLRFESACASYQKAGRNFSLYHFKYLLDRGVDFEALQHGFSFEAGLLLKKLAFHFYADNTIPPFLKHFLRQTIDEMQKTDPAESQIVMHVLNALENPTAENFALLQSAECNAFLSSDRVREFFEDGVKPFLDAKFSLLNKEKTKPEEHLSRAENIIDDFLEQEHLLDIDADNIGDRSSDDMVKWEFAENLRRAARNPTAENWKTVHALKEKYEQECAGNQTLIDNCQRLYDACKVYEKSPLMTPAKMGRDVMSHVFFRLPVAERKAVRAVSRAHKTAIDDLDERTYRYMYPLAYEQILKDIAEKKRETTVDWKAELKQADKLLNTNPGLQLEALFKAIRDPSRDIEAVKKIVKGLNIRGWKDSFWNTRDRLENITFFQCARYHGFKEALTEIFLASSRSWRGDPESDFLAAIACYQPLEVLADCYEALNREDNNVFRASCYRGLERAVALDNLEAIQFLIQKNVVSIDESESPYNYLQIACDNGCVEIAWYLISQGANVSTLSDEQREKLLTQTFGHEGMQENARSILIGVLNKLTQQFQNEDDRPIFKAIKALLMVLMYPTDEYTDALKAHEPSLGGEELKSIYALCKPFIQRQSPQPSEVPLPPSPR